MGDGYTASGPISQALGMERTAALLALAIAALGIALAWARRFAAAIPASQDEASEKREMQIACVVVACLSLAMIGVEEICDFAPERLRALGLPLFWPLAWLVCRSSRLPLLATRHALVNTVLVLPVFLVREPSESRSMWNLFGLFMVLVSVATAHRTRQQAREKERTALLRRLSHDLRTPAAGIRSLAEALERNDISDPAERARSLALIRGEADRLSTGLDRMLRAAKGEPRTAPSRIALDLAEWARAAEARWRTRLPGLTLDAASPVPAVADPELLDEAVDALLDNAMRYGAPGVALRVARGGDLAAISVEDGGAGPSAEARPALERALAGTLPDGESGAPSADGKGGYGLGLWAAGEVARAHGGSASLEGRSRFVLRFPRGGASH